MKIVCLGDSCTYGQNVRADQAWPAVLARLTGHDVRNEGVCGDTTRLGLERWKYAVGLHQPDVVVLQFGHNDANIWDGKRRVHIESYKANLQEMYLRALPAHVMFLAPHPPSNGDEIYRESIEDYADACSDFRVTPVTLLDDGYGVHPDPAMHERYAKLVAEWLGAVCL